VRVAFRADAGVEQGSGHVVRSLTLAKEFEQAGHDVKVIGAIRDIPWLSALVELSGIKWQDTVPSTLDLDDLLKQNFDFLVVDSYKISTDVINSAAQKIETLAIVDNETRGISARYLLDHNLGARKFLTDARTRQLIGPQFALVRKEIRDLRRTSSSRLGKTEKPILLVMFGGTDPRNLSSFVSETINSIDADFEIHFVAPQANINSIKSNLPSNRANIHELTPRIEVLLSKADVVFSAAGTSVLDLSCIGIPSIYMSIAENQNPAIRAIDDLGLGLTIKSGINSRKFKNEIVESINACAFDQQLREDSFTNSQELVDGLGASRVVSIMLASKNR
jgi:spore coat polysaccharide biosynthesis predicted glycosyltransferase SpsG